MSRALILMYHAMDTPRSSGEAGYCVPPAAFRAQMAWLASSGLIAVGLGEVVAALRGEGPPLAKDSVAVSFDDGLECFARHALPVLNEYRIPATVFAVAGRLGESAAWTRTKGWPERHLMDAATLRTIHEAGITIGCHGLTHTPMTDCKESQLRRETAEARAVLRAATGGEVDLFAYPYGVAGDRERAAVAAAGFVAACSTRSGFARGGEEMYALRRIDISGLDGLTHFRRKIAFGANQVTRSDLVRYYAQRIYARCHG